jgi:hypothetical protein
MRFSKLLCKIANSIGWHAYTLSTNPDTDYNNLDYQCIDVYICPTPIKYIAFHKPIIVEEQNKYYGFLLDGNHRFIDPQGIVLRNSGKSHTMMGDTINPGLIPRICSTLFDRTTTHNNQLIGNCDIKYKVCVSYVEIYSEKARDLLINSSSNPNLNQNQNLSQNQNNQSLRIREHPEYGPYIEGLTEASVDNFQQIKKLFEMGNKERTVAKTLMNDTSSRSHAILTLSFTQVILDRDIQKTREIVSKINLVDLAGSERSDKSGVMLGTTSFQEAININLSLAALGHVITELSKQSKNLSEKKTATKRSGKLSPTGSVKSNSSRKSKPKTKTVIPYRNSTLTWLLKESLGGNSKTYMIATISPVDYNLNETLNTLQYANTTKSIINCAKINEDPSDKIIRTLKAELAILKERLRNAVSNNSSDVLAIKSDISDRELLMKEREKMQKIKEEESRALELKYKLELERKDELHKSDLQKMSDSIDKIKTTTQQELEEKKTQFERDVIIASHKELHLYHEKQLEEIRKEYEEKSKQINQTILDENDRLKKELTTLQDELTKVRELLRTQIAQAKQTQAVLSKQIQQLTSRNQILEQRINSTNNTVISNNNSNASNNSVSNTNST